MEPHELASQQEHHAGPEAGGDRLLDMIADVEAQLASLKQAHTARREAEMTLAEREADLAQREQDLVFRFDQIQAEKETLDAARAELEAGRAEIRAGLEEIESRRTAQAERERMVAEDLEQRLELLSQREEEISRGAELVRESRVEIDRLRDELATERAAVAAKTAELAAGEMELRAKLEGLRGRTEAAERRTMELEAELASLRAESHEGGVAGERVQALEAQLSAAVDDRERLESRVTDLSSALEKTREDARAAVARAGREQAERAGAKEAETRAKLEAALRDAEEARAACEALRAELASSRSSREATDRQTAQAAEALKQAKGEAEHARAACERLAAEIQALRQDKADLENDVLGLTAELEQVRQHAARRGDSFTAQRRQRLRNVRAALREQASKLNKANQVLRKRYQQAEQVLAQRGELLVARDALTAAQAKLDGQRRGGRVLIGMSVFLLVLTMVGALSWVTAIQVVPGRYAASAVVAAQSRNRDLTPDEAQEWVRFHQEALNDPRFIELAAERMRRRGIAALGSPAALRERLQADMDHFSSEPATLTIELRGIGGQRTARELETLVTAFTAHANASRLRRADAALTVLRTPPTGADRPIGYEHYAVAGTGLGVAVLLSGALGFGMWRRLATVKTTFDQQAQVDAALEEARWGLPEDLASERIG